MRRRIVLLALALALLQGCSIAVNEKVTIKGIVPDGGDRFIDVVRKEVLAKTNQQVEVETSHLSDHEADRTQLLSGNVDFVITPRPLSDGPNGDTLLHFPISTGGFVIVANVVEGAQPRAKAKQLAGLFSGAIASWNHQSLIEFNPSFASVNTPVKVVKWDTQGFMTTELKRFLEYNGEGAWQATTDFATSAILKSSYQEALETVKSTPGAITYVPYKKSAPLFPFAIYVPQSGDFVSPILAHFGNALMPLKEPKDMPAADDTSAWKQFSLTDMRKMPPDGSCMSMPPYALAHFNYLVVKKDQSRAANLHGAAVAAYIRLISTNDVQQNTPTAEIWTMIPPAAQIANAAEIKKINFKSGESLETFLANVPIQETAPGANMPPGMAPGANMTPGANMDNMKPASTTIVIITIVALLLSGIICVLAYIVFMKVRHGGSFADHATWVPMTPQKATKAT